MICVGGKFQVSIAFVCKMYIGFVIVFFYFNPLALFFLFCFTFFAFEKLIKYGSIGKMCFVFTLPIEILDRILWNA